MQGGGWRARGLQAYNCKLHAFCRFHAQREIIELLPQVAREHNLSIDCGSVPAAAISIFDQYLYVNSVI